ncbi:MAG TPA: spermidine/putrescine ABC transporter substrate-binding protein [Devosiaceae bacterium]|jgi:spermidine/putrescine transport system substrate-binding protein|nr:spermidine/putrescine ABC transporter substrate-binding protein [Devosiaceae bacterium]
MPDFDMRALPVMISKGSTEMTSRSSSSTSPILNRRSLLGMMGAMPAAAALSGFFPRNAHAAGALNIYSWPDYFSQDDLDAYAKKSGVTPNIATYNANELMFAKLNSPAGAGFDIVIPSSGWIKQLADKGLLQPLDHSKINFAALDPSLLNRDYDPGNKYSVPKDWGLLGVVYDPDAVGGEIKTWQDFLDAGAKPGVSGKVRLTKDSGETLGPALWIAGKDWNKASEADIRAAGEVMKDFAKHVKTFSSFDPAAMASGAIVLAQANQAAARGAIQQNPKLKWVVPGPMSEIWVDNYAIAAKAANVEQAYDFLNFFLSPDIQVKETAYLGYPAAIAGLQAKLPQDVQHADLIFGGPGLDFSKLTSFIVDPATIGVYQEVQNEVMAAAGS